MNDDLESLDSQKFDREARRRGYAPREETEREVRAEIMSRWDAGMAIARVKSMAAATVREAEGAAAAREYAERKAAASCASRRPPKVA